MGADISTHQNSKLDFNKNKLFEAVDSIASNFILTMDFKSLKQLSEKEYCEKLTVMTSDIFEKNMNGMEVKYLLQRTQGGIHENYSENLLNEMKQEKFYYFLNENNKFEKQNVTLNSDEIANDEKQRVCNGIAKFYIIIAHLFASIAKTINPMYSYTTHDGKIETYDYFQKSQIPNDVKTTVKRSGLCDKRISALLENLKVDDNENIYFEKKNCDIDVEENELHNENGIYEFQNLYLDDNYDYLTGKFASKSEQSEKIFNQDLEAFYKAFTGQQVMPSEIKRFSDVKLSLISDETCQSNNEAIYEDGENQNLFSVYALNLRQMIEDVNEKQTKLHEILNLLFIKKSDDESEDDNEDDDDDKEENENVDLQSESNEENENDENVDLQSESNEENENDEIQQNLEDEENEEENENDENENEENENDEIQQNLEDEENENVDLQNESNEENENVDLQNESESENVEDVNDKNQQNLEDEENENDNKISYKINPELNEELLYELVGIARKFILEMYINCEKHYKRGVEIYNEIIRMKQLQMTFLQNQNIETQKNHLLQELNINTI